MNMVSGILRGRRISKAKIFKGRYEEWNVQRTEWDGGGGQKKTIHGAGYGYFL